jgi:hypothetical protein
MFFCAAALMSALCAGCSNPNGSAETRTGDSGDVILPITPSDEITAFFEENADLIGYGVFYEHNDYERWEFTDRCMMINSVEEYQQMDFNNVKLLDRSDFTPPVLPAIDFDSHTLVIGQWLGSNEQHFLASQSLVAKPNEITMNLVVGTKDGYHYAYYRSLPIFFLGLYPKMADKDIQINRKN